MRVATRSSVMGSRRGPSSHAAVDPGGGLAERGALAQQPGAEEVGGEVLVAEAEPRVLAVAGEGVDGGEGLAREAPAGVGVLGPGQRVGDRVEVGAHVETVEPVVVGGVHDDGDVGRVDDLHQTAQEPGRPHTPCQRCDHGVSVPADPSDRPCAGPSRVRGRWEGDGTLSSFMSALEPPDDPVAAPPGDESPAPVDPLPVDPLPVEGEDGDDADEVLAQYPPVVAVVVTRNPGPWFEETLVSIGQQDYDDLHVLVVDCGSDDDPTPRVAEVLPRAFVRRLEDGSGFADAANEALHVVEGATFLLLCHDDVVLDPSVVRVLVEEGYRSNAGILGPKLVSAENPDVLLEVGRSIDRFGAPYTGIEPGEVDQEQHDGVRDVFYVPTAVMLVRTDLFTELEGFDPATFPGAEDLDLCWRARLAGARVLVVPDARATHRQAATDGLRDDHPDEFGLARSRVRVLFTSYSFHKLLWLVPVGFVVGFVEALGRPADRSTASRPRRDRQLVLEPVPRASAARVAQAGSGAAHRARLRAARAAGLEHRAARRVPRPSPAHRHPTALDR